MGGATSEQNLQLLCATCNRDKGARWTSSVSALAAVLERRGATATPPT